MNDVKIVKVAWWGAVELPDSPAVVDQVWDGMLLEPSSCCGRQIDGAGGICMGCGEPAVVCSCLDLEEEDDEYEDPLVVPADYAVPTR